MISRKHYIKTALFACLLLCFPTVLHANEAAKVRYIIAKVNNYWQRNNAPEKNAFWDNAAYHTGNMEAYRLTGNEEWLAYSLKWAEHNEWKGAKGNDKSKWEITTMARRTTMCCSATGRFASRLMPTFTTSFPTTDAYDVHGR